MNERNLIEFFRTGLGREQMRLQVELFERDLRRSNADLMVSALRQVAATANSVGKPPNDARGAVMSEYLRKVAELDQLFSVFFTFESAYRSFLSARLGVIYGVDDWWLPVQRAVRSGAQLDGLHRLGRERARPDVVRTVAHILGGAGVDAASLVSCYDLIEAGTLGHVESLIGLHWSPVADALRFPRNRARMTLSEFQASFRRVRLARNDAYHHRSVRERSKVVDAAERLLDMLDIHLGDQCQRLSQAKPAPLSFRIVAEARHR